MKAKYRWAIVAALIALKMQDNPVLIDAWDYFPLVFMFVFWLSVYVLQRGDDD
jgi:hypothetical protein